MKGIFEIDCIYMILILTLTTVLESPSSFASFNCCSSKRLGTLRHESRVLSKKYRTEKVKREFKGKVPAEEAYAMRWNKTKKRRAV